jgi:hypothetical protein
MADRSNYPWGKIPPADARMENVGPWVLGVVKRERERLAKVFEAAGFDQPALIKGILSEADDEAVFKWASPVAKLDDPTPPANPKDDVLW